MMYLCVLIVAAVFLPGCTPALINTTLIEARKNQIHMAVEKQKLSFVCPEIPPCPKAKCPQIPQCPACPRCKVPECQTCPTCPTCPNCPECPGPSEWLKVLKCPEVEPTPCPKVSDPPCECPEATDTLVTCPERTPCPTAATTTNPEPVSPSNPSTLNSRTLESLEPLLAKHIYHLIDEGHSWIIFQRRIHGDVDFYRNWADYREGFGNVNGDFWLGNNLIHKLTSDGNWELRVDLSFNGKDVFAHYSSFGMSSENDNYRLKVGGYKYRSTADDAFGDLNGVEFSTRDRDNDNYNENTAKKEQSIYHPVGKPSYNCAENRRGGWWYNAACSESNLNGEWATRGPISTFWGTTTSSHKSATFTQMKMRKAKESG